MSTGMTKKGQHAPGNSLKRRAECCRAEHDETTKRLDMTLRSLLFSAALVTAGATASAHEFTAGLHVSGPGSDTRRAEIIAGFLLAADERDGHPGETSDGHLGGVDVQVLPLPRGSGTGVPGLFGNPLESPDVVVMFDAASLSALDVAPGTPVVEVGKLPPDQDWQQSDFATRYLATYGSPPTRDAAQGYNEARRLDLAIRPLDGLSPGPEFATAIASSEGGLEW